jgi:hypothetical protein
MAGLPKSPDAQRICNTSGVSPERLQKSLVTMRDVANMLDTSIREAQAAIQDEYFWRAMELSTKLVGVVCDVAISGLEAAASGTPAAGTAKGISATYDVAKLLVDAFNSDVSLQKAIVYSSGAKADAISEILDTSGKQKLGKAVGQLKVTLSVAADLYEYWKGGAVDRLTSPSGTIGARNAAYRQLQRVRLQIKHLEQELQACAADVPAPL